MRFIIGFVLKSFIKVRDGQVRIVFRKIIIATQYITDTRETLLLHCRYYRRRIFSNSYERFSAVEKYSLERVDGHRNIGCQQR